jgi:E3 ubiquitin-protein ligase TRIP12
MTNLNKEEQKKFLLFTTGTSRLPVGGFKNLNPKFTVVKRSTEKGENPDNYLPTVMTCQNYLKIPEYSSYEVLRDKLTYAMNEGNNEFHLS